MEGGRPIKRDPRIQEESEWRLAAAKKITNVINAFINLISDCKGRRQLTFY